MASDDAANPPVSRAEAAQYGLELRAEVLSTVAGGDSRRRGESDVLRVGWTPEESADTVRGAETVRIDGDLTETVEGQRPSALGAQGVEVRGGLDLRCHGEVHLVAGGVNEERIGAELLLAGMTDSMVAGAGLRTTAPVDLWLAGVIGIEEKLGTAQADGALVDIAGCMYEREFHAGHHAAVTATFCGAVFTTTASGFRPLMKALIGVRNLTPGGGGGGGGGGGSPTGLPPPVGGSAPSAAAASTATAGGLSRTADLGRVARSADSVEDIEEASVARRMADIDALVNGAMADVEEMERLQAAEDLEGGLRERYLSAILEELAAMSAEAEGVDATDDADAGRRLEGLLGLESGTMSRGAGPGGAGVEDGHIYNVLEAPVEDGHIYNVLEAPVEDGHVYNVLEAPVEDGHVYEVLGAPLQGAGRPERRWMDYVDSTHDSPGELPRRLDTILGELRPLDPDVDTGTVVDALHHRVVALQEAMEADEAHVTELTLSRVREYNKAIVLVNQGENPVMALDDARVIEDVEMLLEGRVLAPRDLVPLPVKPRHYDDSVVDGFEDAWQRLLHSREQADRNFQRSAGVSGANPGGLHLRAMDHLQETRIELRNMLEDIVLPYADKLGLSAEDIEGYDRQARGVDTHLDLRDALRRGIQEATEAGDIDGANAMRASLESWEHIAQGRIQEALKYANALSAWEGSALPSHLDRQKLVEALQTLAIETMPDTADTQIMSDNEVYARSNAADTYGRAGLLVQEGWNPLPYIAEIEQRAITFGGDGGNMRTHETYAQVRESVAALMDNPEMRSGLPRAPGEDLRSQLRLRRDEHFKAGEFASAWEVQEWIDYRRVQPEPLYEQPVTSPHRRVRPEPLYEQPVAGPARRRGWPQSADPAPPRHHADTPGQALAGVEEGVADWVDEAAVPVTPRQGSQGPVTRELGAPLAEVFDNQVHEEALGAVYGTPDTRLTDGALSAAPHPDHPSRSRFQRFQPDHGRRRPVDISELRDAIRNRSDLGERHKAILRRWGGIDVDDAVVRTGDLDVGHRQIAVEEAATPGAGRHGTARVALGDGLADADERIYDRVGDLTGIGVGTDAPDSRPQRPIRAADYGWEEDVVPPGWDYAEDGRRGQAMPGTDGRGIAWTDPSRRPLPPTPDGSDYEEFIPRDGSGYYQGIESGTDPGRRPLPPTPDGSDYEEFTPRDGSGYYQGIESGTDPGRRPLPPTPDGSDYEEFTPRDGSGYYQGIESGTDPGRRPLPPTPDGSDYEEFIPRDGSGYYQGIESGTDPGRRPLPPTPDGSEYEEFTPRDGSGYYQGIESGTDPGRRPLPPTPDGSEYEEFKPRDGSGYYQGIESGTDPGRRPLPPTPDGSEYEEYSGPRQGTGWINRPVRPSDHNRRPAFVNVLGFTASDEIEDGRRIVKCSEDEWTGIQQGIATVLVEDKDGVVLDSAEYVLKIDPKLHGSRRPQATIRNPEPMSRAGHREHRIGAWASDTRGSRNLADRPQDVASLLDNTVGSRPAQADGYLTPIDPRSGEATGVYLTPIDARSGGTADGPPGYKMQHLPSVDARFERFAEQYLGEAADTHRSTVHVLDPVRPAGELASTDVALRHEIAPSLGQGADADAVQQVRAGEEAAAGQVSLDPRDGDRWDAMSVSEAPMSAGIEPQDRLRGLLSGPSGSFGRGRGEAVDAVLDEFIGSTVGAETVRGGSMDEVVTDIEVAGIGGWRATEEAGAARPFIGEATAEVDRLLEGLDGAVQAVDGTDPARPTLGEARAEVDRLLEELDSAVQAVDGTGAARSRLGEARAEVDRLLEGLDGAVQAVDGTGAARSRLGEARAEVGRLLEELDGAVQAVDGTGAARSRLGEARAEVGRLLEELDSAVQAVDGTGAARSRLGEARAEVDRLLEGLDGAVQAVDGTGAARSRLGEARAEVDRLLEGLDGAVQAVDGTGAARSRLGEARAEVDRLLEGLDGAVQAVDGTGAARSRLSEARAEVDRLLEGLDGAVQAVDGTGAARSRLGEARAEVGRLLEGLDGAVQAVDGTGAARSRLGEARAEVDRLLEGLDGAVQTVDGTGTARSRLSEARAEVDRLLEGLDGAVQAVDGTGAARSRLGEVMAEVHRLLEELKSSPATQRLKSVTFLPDSEPQESRHQGEPTQDTD